MKLEQITEESVYCWFRETIKGEYLSGGYVRRIYGWLHNEEFVPGVFVGFDAPGVARIKGATLLKNKTERNYRSEKFGYLKDGKFVAADASIIAS